MYLVAVHCRRTKARISLYRFRTLRGALFARVELQDRVRGHGMIVTGVARSGVA